MVCIRKKFLYEELKIIHVKYYANTYACKHCEKQTGFGHLVSVKAPARLLKHSLASPSTVADVMTQKYVNGIPLYWQEQIWKQEGVQLPRATLANWLNEVSKPLAASAVAYDTQASAGAGRDPCRRDGGASSQGGR